MDKAYWVDEQESGPPTIEDDAWYQHHVVSRGYPKVKREPKQLPGQQRLSAPEPPRCDHYTFWEGFSVRCGLPAGHEGDHKGMKELSGWPGPEQR